MEKILFVATVTKHINAFHIPYLKYFKEKGYEVHVASNGNEKMEYCDKHYNLPFERSPFKKNNLEAYRSLKKIIDENNYKIVHCHTPVGGVLARLAAKKARKIGTKVIYTAHGFHFFKGAPLLNWLIYYPIEKWLSIYTDCLITINEEDYKRAKKNFKSKDIQLVHGVGVNKEKFDFEMSQEEKQKLRKSLGLKDDDFVIIQVGELNKNKNQIMSIEAMKELIKENENIHLLLVGNGSLESFYREKIEEYNLMKNIHLLGFRTDIAKLLKISDVLLSLSYREGLPVNVMEALVSKVPVIATKCRGNIDLIVDGKNGIIVENNNICQLKNGIMNIKNNKNNYQKYDTHKIEEETIKEIMIEIYDKMKG